jgi:2-polyprenyl-3-methyl-5-hydroxy-6-metoxy-1,4-benzoquinol methylase
MKTMMNVLKQAPFPESLRKWVRKVRSRFRAARLTPERVFTGIYRSNGWRGNASVSGSGSDEMQTRILVRDLPGLFAGFGISSVLDIPCGDFHWMREVDLEGVDYLGADIVGEIIRTNKRRYRRRGVAFAKLDLIRSRLPAVDLVFCRDCLVHLPYADVIRALRNVCASGSQYLATTTFPAQKENRDIRTGDWRALNLELAPFFLPQPLRILNEGCTELDGMFTDKSIGVWRVDDIRRAIASSGRQNP